MGQLMVGNGIVWRADVSCNVATRTLPHSDALVADAPNCWLGTTSL